MAFTQELLWCCAAYGYNQPLEMQGPRVHVPDWSKGVESYRPRIIDNGERKNYALMALMNPELLRDQDRELAKNAREFLSMKLTMTALTRPLYVFEKTLVEAIGEEEPSKSRLGLFVSQIPAYFTGLIEEELLANDLASEPLGLLKEKISITVRIISCNYSTNWGTYYVKAVTQDNRGVLFPCKTALETMTNYRITGKVKRFNQPITHLNYVKIIEEIA